MDPLTITTLVARLTGSAFTIGKAVYQLTERYKSAPKKLKTISAELNLLRYALCQIQNRILSDRDPERLLRDRPELAICFDVYLTGCTLVLGCLNEDIDDITKRAARLDSPDWSGKAKYVWKEEGLRKHLEDIRGLHISFTLVTQLLNTDILLDVRRLLTEAYPTLERAAERSESLRVAYPSVEVAESIYGDDDRASLHAAANEAMTSFQLGSSLDEQLLNSTVYRRVLRVSRSVDAFDREGLQDKINTKPFDGITSLDGEMCAGTSLYPYSDIRPSKTNSDSGRRVELTSVSLSLGSIASGKFLGVTVVSKGTNFRLQERAYKDMVAAFERRHVVFYDTSDRRGWLIDGATALLHVTCAQLRVDDAPWNRNNVAKFRYADALGPGATRSLCDKDNRGLILYTDESVQRKTEVVSSSEGDINSNDIITTTHHSFRVEDLVRENLEKFHMMLQPPKVSGHEFTFSIGQELTGFSLTDVIRRHARIDAQTFKLRRGGAKWAKLTKSVGACVLVGEGLGEMIRPAVEGSPSVPCGKDHMGTTAHLLERMRSFAGGGTSRVRTGVRSTLQHNTQSSMQNEAQDRAHSDARDSGQYGHSEQDGDSREGRGTDAENENRSIVPTEYHDCREVLDR